MQRASIVEELLVRVGEVDVLVVEVDGVGADVDVNVLLLLVGEGLMQLVVLEGLEGDDLSVDEEGVNVLRVEETPMWYCRSWEINFCSL